MVFQVKFIAHRGLWRDRLETNSLPALRRALEAGVSLETDVRLHDSKLVLSHDPPVAGSVAASLSDLLDAYCELRSRSVLFLNIKEDGLLPHLLDLRGKLEGCHFVFFDMSVPELFRYSQRFPPAHLSTRLSELEPEPSAMGCCGWIWADGFTRDPDIVRAEELAITHGKQLAFVSPELHGRPPEAFWERLRDRRGYLCSDRYDSFLARFPQGGTAT